MKTEQFINSIKGDNKIGSETLKGSHQNIKGQHYGDDANKYFDKC